MEEECHGATGAKRVGPNVIWGEAEGRFPAAEAASRSELPEEVKTRYADRPSGALEGVDGCVIGVVGNILDDPGF